MFNAARVLLATKGIDPARSKTHKTVHRLFSLEFVQEGIFDEEDGRALRRASESRNLADYDSLGLSAARAQTVMNSMERFMANVNALLNSTAPSEKP
jgi:uncharacterized protein (UPF0332 family)